MSICPQCQTPVTHEDKFCGYCGHALQHAPGSPRRRTEHAIDVVEVKYRLGIVYYKKENLPAAAKLWQEVLSLNPRHQAARDMLNRIETQREAEE